MSHLTEYWPEIEAEEEDENERGLLSEKTFKRDTKRERDQLEKWFREFRQTDFPNRFLTNQYWDNYKRLEELQRRDIESAVTNNSRRSPHKQK